MNTIQKIMESNSIEGICREPTPEEIIEFERFLGLPKLTIGDLERFVSVYEPSAKLRDKIGMNVIVGKHTPPAGGVAIQFKLEQILFEINYMKIDSYSAYCEFETLHPFTDCNGRLGRMIWYWVANGNDVVFDRGFYASFHYQALDYYDGRLVKEPNEDTAEAIRRLNDGESERFKSTKELYEDLGKADDN